MRITLGLTAALIIIATITFRDAGTQESPASIRVNLDSVTIRSHPTLEWAQILGQVVNEGAFPVGDVKVNVAIIGEGGKVLDAGAIPVLGQTVDLNGEPNDHGILPGGSAVFDDTFLNVDVEEVVSYDFTITYRIADNVEVLTASTLTTRLESIEIGIDTNGGRISTLEARIDSIGTVAPTLLGDLDNDNDVDFADFLTFASQFGKTL